MSKAQPIRAFRPVSFESLSDLEVFNSAPDTFPRHAMRGRAVLGASIVSVDESRQFNRIKYNPQPTKSLRSVFHPYPESATQSVTLEVKDVAFFGHHLWRRSLALILDDPSDILLSEREEYFHRMQKTIARQNTPHVSVLDFEPTHSTKEVLEWAQSNAPQSITLDPVTTYPELASSTPKKINEPKRKPQTAHHVPDYSQITIRTVSDRPSIPRGLLLATQQGQTQAAHISSQ